LWGGVQASLAAVCAERASRFVYVVYHLLLLYAYAWLTMSLHSIDLASLGVCTAVLGCTLYDCSTCLKPHWPVPGQCSLAKSLGTKPPGMGRGEAFSLAPESLRQVGFVPIPHRFVFVVLFASSVTLFSDTRLVSLILPVVLITFWLAVHHLMMSNCRNGLQQATAPQWNV
jgi:hypothetical protein